MSNFKRNIGNFFRNFERKRGKSYGRVAKSSGYTQAGDIFAFNFPPTKHSYPSPEPFRVVLVVKAYGGHGIATNSAGNPVLCAFQINKVPPAIMQPMFEKLYKNRSACSYSHIIKNLTYIFGEDNFRTFGLHKISDLHELNIDSSEVNFGNDVDYDDDDFKF